MIKWLKKLTNSHTELERHPKYLVTCGKCSYRRVNYNAPMAIGGPYQKQTGEKERSEDRCPKCNHNGGVVEYIN